MALNLAKASPVALRNAAQSMLDKSRYVEAENYLLEILRRNLNDPSALALMSIVCWEKGRPHEAVTCIMAAVNADPAELSYQERLIEYGGAVNATDYGAQAEKAILACLKSGERLDFSRIRTVWGNLLVQNPAFHTAFGLAGRKTFDPANRIHFESLTDFRPLFEPFFLLGIRQINIGDALFEEFITHIRRHIFRSLRLGEKKLMPDESLTLAEAVAHYVFHTDYILDVTEEEQKEIDVLRKALEAGMENDPAHIALFACYAPLYTLKNAEQIAKTYSASAIAGVIRRQIMDYDELHKIASEITAITPIDDAISWKVREQYEEFPYPQWNLISQQGLSREWKGMNVKFLGDLFDKKISILSAGCGTGQETALLSSAFPQAEILAVDLSRSSLAYAMKKADEYGLKNITFRQADILQLGILKKKFDFISSMGVLHHMQDPVKGWQVLYDLLNPGGTMMIALYSKIARKSVLETREIIKQRGYGHDATEMKRFRRESPEFMDKETLKNISRWRDYYFMPMYRDLLFHVQEHDYDLKEIDAILKKLKLDFLGFSLGRAALNQYARQFSGDPSMTNLQNWHTFEEKNPETFREMYLFCCRKPF